MNLLKKELGRSRMHCIAKFKCDIKGDERAAIGMLFKGPIIGQGFEQWRRVHSHLDVLVGRQHDSRNVLFAPKIEAYRELRIKLVGSETVQNPR